LIVIVLTVLLLLVILEVTVGIDWWADGLFCYFDEYQLLQFPSDAVFFPVD
jgi:hypothetical protein